MSKTVLFQTIQFSISTLFKCQNSPISNNSSDGNEGVLPIPQSSSISRTSPSDFFCVISRTIVGGLTPLQKNSRCILQPRPLSRLGPSLRVGESYSSAEPPPADWAISSCVVVFSFCFEILYLLLTSFTVMLIVIVFN